MYNNFFIFKILPFYLCTLLFSNKVFCNETDTTFYRQLANYWAPIHYQSIKKSDGIFNNNALNGKSDSLTSMNYDGDWIATNNWDNLPKHNTDATVYYYVAATSTHYFITYGFFHPRDWTRFNLFNLAQHENDLEGITLIIKKDNSQWGKLILGYSVFHLSLKRYYYTTDSDDVIFEMRRYAAGSNEDNHPISYQQPRGHGIKLNDDFFKPNRSYCRYIPGSLELSEPKDIQYNLISFLDSNQLFQHIGDPDFFNKDESIKGSHGEGANPPWLWKDKRDRKSHPELQLFLDPAKYLLIDCKFDNSYSTEYTYHPFLKTIFQQ